MLFRSTEKEIGVRNATSNVFMVSTDDLYDDYYIYDEDSMSYMGEHTHKTYTIGDKVKVTLVRASLIDRVIDFEFAQEEN